MRMGRHERARKRVERIIRRYSKLLEFLEAYKPPACNPLDPLFRPKHDKTSGTNGQNISIWSEWPHRLGPTQRIILELLAYYDKNGSLIGNIIEDAETIYGVKLTYYQVAGALKRLLKRGLVQRIERGRYILVIPSSPQTPATRIHVENAELKSPYRKEPLTRTANDYYTLYELALEASKERANKVTRVELYIPLRWGINTLKNLLGEDGSRIVKIYYNKEQNIVKAEFQVYGAKTPLGITTLQKWTRDFTTTMFVAAVSTILTLATMEGVQGYLPDSTLDSCIIRKLFESIKKVSVGAR